MILPDPILAHRGLDASHNWHASWKRAEFYIADRLHMTVGELRERMTRSEFLDWLAFYRVKAEILKDG